MMAANAGASLPRQMPAWADLKAAYRLLNNPRVDPQSLGETHHRLTFNRCLEHPVVLCVQDDTEIHGVKVAGGRGVKDGEVLHSTLGVTPQGQLLGILNQRWFTHVEPVTGETQGQRAARWRESDVWADAVQAVAELGDVPPTCRVIHVADRGSDNLRFMHACVAAKVGFVVRAQHDRRVEQGTDKLWDHMAGQPPAGSLRVTIGAQRDKAGRLTRAGREALLEVRYATVQLDPPHNHPDVLEALSVQVVYLRETQPPEGIAPVDWMLLSSEPANSLTEALVIAGYYQKRWVIEEWHRALKEGCGLEHSQVQTLSALRRLSALLSVVAIRLLELRDLARGPEASVPAALTGRVDLVYLQVVALLAKVTPAALTPELFWKTVARRGGFIGRKSDGQPGWKVIWRGWHDISQMVDYAQLAHDSKTSNSCG